MMMMMKYGTQIAIIIIIIQHLYSAIMSYGDTEALSRELESMVKIYGTAVLPVSSLSSRRAKLETKILRN